MARTWAISLGQGTSRVCAIQVMDKPVGVSANLGGEADQGLGVRGIASFQVVGTLDGEGHRLIVGGVLAPGGDHRPAEQARCCVAVQRVQNAKSRSGARDARLDATPCLLQLLAQGTRHGLIGVRCEPAEQALDHQVRGLIAPTGHRGQVGIPMGMGSWMWNRVPGIGWFGRQWQAPGGNALRLGTAARWPPRSARCAAQGSLNSMPSAHSASCWSRLSTVRCRSKPSKTSSGVGACECQRPGVGAAVKVAQNSREKADRRVACGCQRLEGRDGHRRSLGATDGGPG